MEKACAVDIPPRAIGDLASEWCSKEIVCTIDIVRVPMLLYPDQCLTYCIWLDGLVIGRGYVKLLSIPYCFRIWHVDQSPDPRIGAPIPQTGGLVECHMLVRFLEPEPSQGDGGERGAMLESQEALGKRKRSS